MERLAVYLACLIGLVGGSTIGFLFGRFTDLFKTQGELIWLLKLDKVLEIKMDTGILL